MYSAGRGTQEQMVVCICIQKQRKQKLSEAVETRVAVVGVRPRIRRDDTDTRLVDPDVHLLCRSV